MTQQLMESLLAVSTPAEDSRQAEIFLALTLSVVLAVVVVSLFNNFNTRKQRKATLAESAARQRFQAEQAQREQFHFEQGQMINQVGLKKMQLETQLLQTQVQIAEHELAARQRHEQINSVAIEKLRLEVESLKLHIREQHKRLDDFSSGYE
ncbi:MAG: hypothetical protein GC200_09695 [Tepidisphaera sp.]|nr:hypothetical protein [Tepidisphaera sp.]